MTAYVRLAGLKLVNPHRNMQLVIEQQRFQAKNCPFITVIEEFINWSLCLKPQNNIHCQEHIGKKRFLTFHNISVLHCERIWPLIVIHKRKIQGLDNWLANADKSCDDKRENKEIDQ